MKDFYVVRDPDRSVVHLRPVTWRMARPRRFWPYVLTISLIVNAVMRLIQGF